MDKRWGGSVSRQQRKAQSTQDAENNYECVSQTQTKLPTELELPRCAHCNQFCINLDQINRCEACGDIFHPRCYRIHSRFCPARSDDGCVSTDGFDINNGSATGTIDTANGQMYAIDESSQTVCISVPKMEETLCAMPGCGRARQYPVGFDWDRCCKICLTSDGVEHEDWCKGTVPNAQSQTSDIYRLLRKHDQNAV